MLEKREEEKMTKIIRQATHEDIYKVIGFLVKAGLSTEGVKSAIDCFLVVEDEEQNLIGTLGIEMRGRTGLLRSLVVTPEFDSEEIFSLFQEIFKLAKEKDLAKLYLITNRRASLNFFEVLGFQQEPQSFVDELKDFVHAKQLSTVDNLLTMSLHL
jgi:N-acetylglutamate synthase-like GNAT family acetyltransferase